MKVFKKAIVMILAVIMTMSVCGCGNKTSGGTTAINIMNVGGGIGRVWLDEAIVRYKENNPGVIINIEHNINTGVATMASSGYNIYFVEEDTNILDLAASDKLMNITDIVTEKVEEAPGVEKSIEDKITTDYRFALQGGDGNYYALPHYSYIPGLTYDAELFDELGLYFADYTLPENEVNVWSCDFGTAKFVKNSSTKKSVGNDGTYGTADDGLPSTFVEFLCLCDYMANDRGAIPFELNGRSNHYISYLIRGIWNSLSGYDVMKRTYTYDGEMEIVTGFADESLFPNTNVKKPITEKVQLTESTGYLAYDNVNRYYATALVEIAVSRGWFSSDAESNASHIDAQTKFVFGDAASNGKSYAMLIEGNYWFNESSDNEVFDNYYLYTNRDASTNPRNIKWMPLPTGYNTPVTKESEARENSNINANLSFAFINNNIKENTALVGECKKFLQFLYSDAELSHFVGNTGVMRTGLEYEVLSEDYNKLSDFQKSVVDIYKNNRLLSGTADNKTFKNHSTALTITGNSVILEPRLDGIHYNNYFRAIKAGYSAKAIFETTKINQEKWSTSYYEE